MVHEAIEAGAEFVGQRDPLASLEDAVEHGARFPHAWPHPTAVKWTDRAAPDQRTMLAIISDCQVCKFGLIGLPHTCAEGIKREAARMEKRIAGADLALGSDWTNIRVFCDPKMEPGTALMISGSNCVKAVNLAVDAPEPVKVRRKSALVELLKLMQIPYNAQIIKGRGEPFLCESTGMTTMRYRIPGVAGENSVTFKVGHTPPYQPVNQPEKVNSNAQNDEHSSQP